MSALTAEAVAKSYSGRRVVNGVNIEIKGGEIVGLLGPNGAGKTTTFHIMVGLVQPDEGKVILNDHDLTSAPIYQRAQMAQGKPPRFTLWSAWFSLMRER